LEIQIVHGTHEKPHHESSIPKPFPKQEEFCMKMPFLPGHSMLDDGGAAGPLEGFAAVHETNPRPIFRGPMTVSIMRLAAMREKACREQEDEMTGPYPGNAYPRYH
jgi:hypothetical protein